MGGWADIQAGVTLWQHGFRDPAPSSARNVGPQRVPRSARGGSERPPFRVRDLARFQEIARVRLGLDRGSVSKATVWMAARHQRSAIARWFGAAVELNP